MGLWNRGGREPDGAGDGDAPQDAIDIVLERCDLAEVGTISHKGTLALLPAGSKGRQKIAVGDDTGAVHVFEMKRGEATTVFKFDGLEGAITALALGGSAAKRDRIFATQGSTVVGLTKKGKEFFRLTSTLSEPIRFLRVRDSHIWTACDFLYNQYNDGKDAGFYMCRDRVTSLEVADLAIELTGNVLPDAVLGCNDRCIRVIRGAELVGEVATDGAVVAMDACGGPGTGLEPGLLYGTDAGTVGHLARCSAEQGWLRKTWELPSQKGPASVVRRFDVTGSGRDDLVVGRDDGTLQVYRREDESGGTTGAGGSSGGGGGGGGSGWQLWFEAELGESVRAVECGVVGAAGFNDIVVCTYSGKIISFTTEPLHQADASADANGRTVGGVNAANKVKQLQRDIADLEKRVAAGKAQLAKLAPAAPDDALPPPPQLQLTAQSALDADAAATVITVEAPVPLEMILLHSTTPLDLLGAGEEAAGGVLLSVKAAEPRGNGASSGAVTEAVFRCPEGTSRFVIKARTIEGNSGEITLTAVGRTKPQPSAQVVRLKTKPLSLHSRLHILTDEVIGRPKNVMHVTGGFSMGVVHDWIAACLPDVPPKSQEDSATLHFVNVFTKSVLTCEYRKGEAVISSDSISAVAIIKEVISREATARRIAVNDALQTSEDSVRHVIGLLHPKLQEQFLLASQVKMTAAVTELCMGNTTTAPWLSPQHAYIADNASHIQKAFKERPRVLEYLTGIVTDLYVDWYKVNGRDVKAKIPELVQLLAAYDREKLAAFILKR